jgi:hypothetical protein
MVEPERTLWRAVLIQAYEDAEMTSIGDTTGADPLECAEARRFLRADSRFEAGDLMLVCEFADLPADRIYSWARLRYPLAA